MSKPTPQSINDRDQVIAKVRRVARVSRWLKFIERFIPVALIAAAVIMIFTPSSDTTIWQNLVTMLSSATWQAPLGLGFLSIFLASSQSKRLHKLYEFNDPHTVPALLEVRPQVTAESKRSRTALDNALVRLIPAMKPEHIAELAPGDIDLLADLALENKPLLQVACLALLGKVGGEKHLAPVDSVIEKLRSDTANGQSGSKISTSSHVLSAAEHCAEAIRNRIETQHERDTLLRASSPVSDETLLRPIGLGSVEENTLLLSSPLDEKQPEQEATPVPVLVGASNEANDAMRLEVNSHATI
jgi:hypothetical protein